MVGEAKLLDVVRAVAVLERPPRLCRIETLRRPAESFRVYEQAIDFPCVWDFSRYNESDPMGIENTLPMIGSGEK